MENLCNKYEVRFRLFSKAGTHVMACRVKANSFGDAENKFDEMFSLVNTIHDDVYGDDCVYEIVGIEKVEKESEVAK